MRRIFTIILSMLIFLLLSLTPILAQDDHTAREEREGKVIWDRLQQKKATCDKLSDEDFERLGEYYMGQMAGNAHEAMNNMMIQMMGEKGEEQMHGVMGKRLSGCDNSAQFPSQGLGFMPMMGMMQMMAPLRQGFEGQGGGDRMMGYGGFNNMMGGWGGFGFFGLLFWLLWIFVLVDLVLLGIWLWKRVKKEK